MLIVSNNSEGNLLQPTTIPFPNQLVEEIRHFYKKPLLASGFLISYSLPASTIWPHSQLQHVSKYFFDHTISCYSFSLLLNVIAMKISFKSTSVNQNSLSVFSPLTVVLSFKWQALHCDLYISWNQGILIVARFKYTTQATRNNISRIINND